MEIRLTGRQFDAIEKLFRVERRWEQWFDRAEPTARRDVTMPAPAIAWLNMRNTLVQRCFTARGQRSSKVPKFESRALTTIARALADLHIHPALRGEAMAGNWSDVLPVWEPLSDRPWSEFPMDSAPFSVMLPRWVTVGGLDVTIWSPYPADHDLVLALDDPLCREEQHRAFGIYDITAS